MRCEVDTSGKRWITFEGVSPGDAVTSSFQDLKLNWQDYRRQVTGRPGMAPDELSDERIATIELRLDQAFAFCRDVLENPALLEEIPDGSTLRFSDVIIEDAVFHLTAYPDTGPNWMWTAKVTGPADKIVNWRERAGASRFGTEETRGSAAAHSAHGHTAEDALSALETTLRDTPPHRDADFRPGRRTAWTDRQDAKPVGPPRVITPPRTDR